MPGTPARPADIASDRPPRRDRKGAILLGAVALLAAIYLLPAPPPLERAGNLIPLTANGKLCLAIMAFAVTLWVTETLPLPGHRAYKRNR